MKRILLAMAALALTTPAFAEIPNPPPLDPTKSVVDGANILDDAQEAALEAQTRQIYDATHHHIVVLTTPTMEGYSGVEYGNNAFRYYKIGNRTRNDGVLLLVSMSNPRRLQIVPGYGLEGELTDARSVEITEAMKPVMKAGDYGAAISQGVDQIGTTITKEVVTPQQLAATAPGTQTAVEKAESSDTWLTILAIFLVLGLAWLAFYLFIQRPKHLKAKALLLRINGLISDGKTYEYRDDLINAQLKYQQALELDPSNETVQYKLASVARDIQRKKDEAIAAAARAAEAAKPKPTVVERVRETFTKPSPSVGRTPTAARNYSPPPAPPKRDTGPSAAALAAAAEEQRRRDRKRQQDRDDEDRRQRQRDDDDRRSRDAAAAAAASSSSSSWGGSSSSSSSDYSSPSPSYDSGGSSGGGGGGSDW